MVKIDKVMRSDYNKRLDYKAVMVYNEKSRKQ